MNNNESYKYVICNEFIPRIGFGTADLLGNKADIIFNAIVAGYRLIDTAQVYDSEKDVGLAVKKAINEGFVKRNDLFIQSKLAPQNHGYYKTLKAFNNSLERLELDYLDMFLIHWPVPRGEENCYSDKNRETWQAFSELKLAGKIKHLGVCNFLERHLFDIYDYFPIKPEVNQLEIHPDFQQRGLTNFCKKIGIIIEAWSPMGRGILKTNQFKTMAESYDKNCAQLALRWSIQKGFIPLTRSSDFQHLKTNLNVFDWEISIKDMEILDSLNTNTNYLDIWAYKRQQMY